MERRTTNHSCGGTPCSTVRSTARRSLFAERLPAVPRSRHYLDSIIILTWKMDRRERDDDDDDDVERCFPVLPRSRFGADERMNYGPGFKLNLYRRFRWIGRRRHAGFYRGLPRNPFYILHNARDLQRIQEVTGKNGYCGDSSLCGWWFGARRVHDKRWHETRRALSKERGHD